MIVVSGWLAAVAAATSTISPTQSVRHVLIKVCLAHVFGRRSSNIAIISAAAAVPSLTRARQMRVIGGTGADIGTIQLRNFTEIHMTVDIIWITDVTAMTSLVQH